MPFVPEGFVVPTVLETQRFRLRPLTIHDVIKDYEAMMSRVVSDPTLTIEQNLIDLGWHQYEFQNRRSFTFTVMNLDESRCLGCVYMYPPTEGDTWYDARILMWVRESELASGMDGELFDAVRRWVASHWPFQRVVFPGRDPATE
jgi:hypothetical protein